MLQLWQYEDIFFILSYLQYLHYLQYTATSQPAVENQKSLRRRVLRQQLLYISLFSG